MLNQRYQSRICPEYIWRVFNISQMDFQFTFSQMVNLCRSPSDVYKSTKFRKQIKNQWARDDPAFVAVLCWFILLASLAYSVTFGVNGPLHFWRIVAGHVFIEFLGFGCLIATTLRWIANKFMRVQRILSTEQEVEWLYSFDIHCNGYFPVFVLLYVVQFFLVPVLIREDFLATLLANSLYAIAFSYYFYITFLGYNALPFLQNTTTRFLTVPIMCVLIGYACSLLFNVNMCRFVLELYFGS